MPKLLHHLRSAKDGGMRNLPLLRSAFLRGVSGVVKMEKYTGRSVEIIYRDRLGRLTQRRIRVQAVHAGKVKAYDLEKLAPRLFDANRILALMPVSGRAAV